jgi:hypothetical protein
MDQPYAVQTSILDKIERAAAQVGVSELQLFQLMAAGMDVPDLLEYVEGRLRHVAQ